MRNYFLVSLCIPLALTACNLVEVENAPAEPADSVEDIAEDVPVRETKNVTYEGEIQPAGISIYQQGSHRLVLPGGKFILLESDTLDLNGYVGEKVRIFGALRPTVEAGGMIMRVERIELMEPTEQLPENTGEEPTEEDPTEEPGAESADPETTPAEELPSDEEGSSSESEAMMEESSESSAMSESSSEPSAEFRQQVEVMSRQEYDAANWTQQYCTSHIGFCAPVHRNWWFKSFGATNTTLWHVEFSAAPIDALNEGPIAVDLMAGSVGEQDGTVDVTGGKATGYLEWTFGRHFRISGDDSLEAAVRYITENITEYAQ